jgi:very-short-patch-repair endonuclease
VRGIQGQVSLTRFRFIETEIREEIMDRMEPIPFAKYLRQTSNSYEQLLWQLLRNRQRCGKKFRRQHPLGIYTADFYCAEARLVLEIDGSPHETIEGKRRDEARDDWMLSQGIEVLRFGGWQIESDTQQVLQAIDEMLLQRCAK